MSRCLIKKEITIAASGLSLLGRINQRVFFSTNCHGSDLLNLLNLLIDFLSKTSNNYRVKNIIVIQWNNHSKAMSDDIEGNDTNGTDWFFLIKDYLCCDVAIFPLSWLLLRVFRLSLISTLFVSIKIRPIICGIESIFKN